MRLPAAVCAICVLLAARAEAVPQPTSEHPAPVEGREHAEKPKWASAVLGQEYYYQPVSPDPIPTPVPAAFGDTFTDILNVSNNDGPIETNRRFEFCANEGEGLPFVLLQWNHALWIHRRQARSAPKSKRPHVVISPQLRQRGLCSEKLRQRGSVPRPIKAMSVFSSFTHTNS